MANLNLPANEPYQAASSGGRQSSSCSKSNGGFNLLPGHQNAPDYTMLDPQTVTTDTPGVTCTHHPEYTIFEFAWPQLDNQAIYGIGTPRITVTYDKDPANPTTDTLQRLTEVLLNSWSIAKGIIKEEHQTFWAWRFHNPPSSKGGNEDIMDSWVINAELLRTGAGNRAAVNISNATKSPFTPLGGFKDAPEVKEMPEKLRRLYIASHVQLRGVVQDPRCRNCKKTSKECKRMADSQVTKSKLCGHCLRGGLKGCTDPVDANEADGKDKTKMPGKSPANKSSPATKSAVEGDGKEKKKTPAKSLASKQFPAALSATNPFNLMEKANHLKTLVNAGAAQVPKYREVNDSDDDQDTTMDSGSKQQRTTEPSRLPSTFELMGKLRGRYEPTNSREVEEDEGRLPFGTHDQQELIRRRNAEQKPVVWSSEHTTPDNISQLGSVKKRKTSATPQPIDNAAPSPPLGSRSLNLQSEAPTNTRANDQEATMDGNGDAEASNAPPGASTNALDSYPTVSMEGPNSEAPATMPESDAWADEYGTTTEGNIDDGGA